MRISPVQMDGFSREAAATYEDRLVDFLKLKFDDAREEPDERIRPAVHEEVAKARSYGLSTESQAATYVTTAWILGRDFDTSFPAAEEVLRAETVPPEEKATWLREWANAMVSRLAE